MSYKHTPLLAVVLLLSLLLTGCLKENGSTLVIPEMQEVTPRSLLPQYLFDSLSHHIDIYTGETPPVIEGSFHVSPTKIQYSSDGSMMDASFADSYFRFTKQNARNLCIYEEEQTRSYTYCDSAIITGTGNKFTFVGKTTTVNKEDNTSATMGTLISGTIGSDGITNFVYAIYMIDKVDPDSSLMRVGTFRIFGDGDDLVERTNWEPSANTKHPTEGSSLQSMIARKETAR